MPKTQDVQLSVGCFYPGFGSRYPVPARGRDRSPAGSGKHNQKYSTLRRRGFYGDVSPVILHDLLHYSETQSGAVLLAMTHERFEQPIANKVGNSAAIIGHTDFNSVARAMQADMNLPGHRRNCFARVDQQILEHSL